MAPRFARLGMFLLVAGPIGYAWLSYAPVSAQENDPSTEMSGDSQSEDKTAAEDSAAKDSGAAEGLSSDHQWSLLALAVGIVVVLGLIIGLKVNAFIALITAAMVVSVMAGGDVSGIISRVAKAFGDSAGGIGIVIALAAVIGKCMLDSGAADRVVRAFLNALGEKRSPAALMGSGFVLAVPVFFDTVFYLLVPLARSLYRKTNRDYLKYILAIGAGGAITHTLVPPTPGPLMMASNLGFDVGVMIMVGAAVALPAAVAGLLFAGLMNRIMPVPMRQVGDTPDPEPLKDEELPSLFVSLLPVVLPVILISTNTVLTTIADGERAAQFREGDIADWGEFRTELNRQADLDKPTPGGRILEVIEGKGSKDAKQREQLLTLLKGDQPLSDEDKATLREGLNQHILGNKEFYEESAWIGYRLDETTKGLLSANRVRMKKVVAERMNRLLLETAFNAEAAEDEPIIKPHNWKTPARQRANVSSLIGNANLALLISAVIAMWTLVRQRGLSLRELAASVETALMSGGVIILITAAGGAFGEMLKAAEVGDAIKALFAISDDAQGAGLTFLVLGFAIAAVLKVAQGSSTVAMITGSAMLASIAQPELLGFHPVYLATAIGGGSLVGSWMNDSGFWIFAKMGGLTEPEALKSWTVMLVILGVISFVMSILLASVMPLV